MAGPSRLHLYRDHSDVGLRMKPSLESVVFSCISHSQSLRTRVVKEVESSLASGMSRYVKELLLAAIPLQCLW